MSTRCSAPFASSQCAVYAKSFKMQKPLPASAKAWWVPPAVLTARPCCSASCAVRRVPATSDLVRSTSVGVRVAAPKPILQTDVTLIGRGG
jgi:hypothetical protein